MTSPYQERPVRWQEFVQRIRAHRRTDLLRTLAAVAAEDFTGLVAAPRTGGWNPWSIAAVARESIAYGNEHRSKPITDQALARILDAFHDLDDPIISGGEASGPWDLLLRLAYQQFDVSGSVFPELARFAAMFDRDYPAAEYSTLNADSLRELLGVPVTDYLGATFLFTVGAMRNQGQFDLAWLTQPQFRPVVETISAETLCDIFQSTFGAPIGDVSAIAQANRHRSTALRVHDFNPLVATPYVGLTAAQFLAPVPHLVADKASVAAVYHLGQGRWQHAFTSELGHLVETYAGEHLRLIPTAAVTPEREYAPGAKSVDWIVVLPNVILLVEVKSARVNQPARTNFAAYHDDVRIDVGKAFTQLHRTADLIRTGHAAFADIPTDRPLRGLVVTAEPHYLINSPIYREGLPEPTIPTAVMSLGELESTAAFSLVRDPSEVILSLTGSAPTQGINVTATHNDWYRQYPTPPRNPILDEAWNRMPWRDAAPPT